MKFGIHNPSWVYGPDPAEAFEAVKAKAQWAEDHGFVWFSVMDHLIQIGGVGAPDEPFMEGRTVLSALAAVTSRIRLATLATSVGYRNPAHLAKIAAGGDLISRGRLTPIAPRMVPAVCRRVRVSCVVHGGAAPCRRHGRRRRSSAMIEGISAITLGTHDMRRAVRFYRVLGFILLCAGEDEGFTSFKAGGNFVNLIAQPAERQWSWWGRVIFYHSDGRAICPTGRRRLPDRGAAARRGMGRALLPYYRSRRT